MFDQMKRNWERRKRPQDLPHMLGKSLADYKDLIVYQLAGIPSLNSSTEIERCEEVEVASKYIEYLARDKGMPYILSAEKKCLVEILHSSYPSHIYDAGNTLIRLCLVRSTMAEGWAVPVSGFDNRRTFPEEGKIDLNTLPNWSWLLHEDEFRKLMDKDDQCFVSALTQTRQIRYLPATP